MEFTINPVPPEERKAKPENESKLGFGQIFSDHMFTMKWSAGTGWHDPAVGPYGPFELAPASLVLHYGQSIFEGLKAYRNQQGSINLFRPFDNFSRFNISAARLDLPEIDENIVMQAVETLLELDHEWTPKSHGTSLYIRPTMIGVEPYIGLKSASEVLFFIITGPVGAYYPEGFNPVTITVCEEYSRAGPGGLGSVKTAANYAASLLAEKEAKQAGYTQVLWLDAAERKYIEEVGSMNILFKIGGKVITPPPGESILDGITRRSALELLRSWDIPVEEHRLTIDDVIRAHKDGTLEEIFGAGTAAVISPVGGFHCKDQDYQVANGEAGPIALRLFDELMGIQYGNRPDPFQWIHQVVPSSMTETIPVVPMAAKA